MKYTTDPLICGIVEEINPNNDLKIRTSDRGIEVVVVLQRSCDSFGNKERKNGENIL